MRTDQKEREGKRIKKTEGQGRSCIRSAVVSKGTVPGDCGRTLSCLHNRGNLNTVLGQALYPWLHISQSFLVSILLFSDTMERIREVQA